MVAEKGVKRAHVSNNSGNNEWYTPADYIALAREVMGGIDTDPASSEIANRTVQAAQIFTAEDNGLTKQWRGRVWCNPPYAQPLITEFSEAIVSKYESGEIEQACVLVNNGTETRWFQRMLSTASAVCFPRSRIRFIDPDGNPSGAPLQGQAVLYMGDNREAFAAAFAKKGAVLFNGGHHQRPRCASSFAVHSEAVENRASETLWASPACVGAPEVEAPLGDLFTGEIIEPPLPAHD